MPQVPADDLDRTIPVPVRRPAPGAAAGGAGPAGPGFTPQLVRLYLLLGARG